MSLIMNCIVSTLLLVIPFNITGQENTVTEILNKTANFYSNTSTYAIQMEHTLLRGNTGLDILESYKGSFIKKGNFSKLVLLNSEIIQFPESRLIIDHDNKAIEFSKTPTGPSTPIDLDVFQKYYKSSVVKSQNNVWICEFTIIPSAISTPYNKVILHINKDTYTVEKQILFLTQKLPFKGENGENEEEFGRLVITFVHTLNLQDTHKEKLEEYLLTSGKKRIPVDKYKGYQVVNLSN